MQMENNTAQEKDLESLGFPKSCRLSFSSCSVKYRIITITKTAIKIAAINYIACHAKARIPRELLVAAISFFVQLFFNQ